MASMEAAFHIWKETQEIGRTLDKINRNLENMSNGLDKIADILRKTTEAMQKYEAQARLAKEKETAERLVKESSHADQT